MAIFLIILQFSLGSFAVALDGFSREFISNFPNGSVGFHHALKERRQWSYLELLDNVGTLPNPNMHFVFHSLGPVIQCPSKLLQSYGTGDGEKRICGKMSARPCVVISLGSRNSWHFENDLVSMHPECKVHTFDCYHPGIVPPDLTDSVTSYDKCIGSHDLTIDGKEFLSWKSILQLIGTNVPPTALKMDIEGFEWVVIRQMLISTPHNLLPMSISFELHTFTDIPEIRWQRRYRQGSEIALFMEFLMKYGYFLVDRHDNPSCHHCTEIVVARIAPAQKN
jgi:hypothetical protein